MEETSEEPPNFSIGIDLLGPDPTSSENNAELKKSRKLRVSQICRKTELQQILAERHSLGIEKTPIGH